MDAPGKAVTTAVAVSLVMIVATLAFVTLSAVSASSLPAAPTGAPHDGASVGAGTALDTAGAGSARAPASTPALPPPPTPPACTVTVSTENVGDNAIQTAINAASSGAVICIGAGTWPEQLTIQTSGITLLGAGNGSTIIEPAAPLAYDTYDYDASGGATSVPAAAIVLVEGSSATPTTGVSNVVLENLQVNGAAGATTFSSCSDGYFGVDYQASSGNLTGVSVVDVAMPTDLYGCQTGTGLGVYVYDGVFNFPAAHAPDVVGIFDSTVSQYQKNGITCDDTGVRCAIFGTTVTGIGGTTLTAQNGVQIAYGASVALGYSSVTGDHYTGDVPADIDYFEPVYGATGILVYDPGNTVSINHNSLSGDDISIYVQGATNATVDSNTISQGYSYGITFDLNTSANWLGLPVYGTNSPWTSVAGDNIIDNVNVGILDYDDNLTVAGGSMNGVNVSVEAMFDHPGSTYSLGVFELSATANVDGLLLGNISAYQSTAGFFPIAEATVNLGVDQIYSAGLAYPAGSDVGVSVFGAVVVADNLAVYGFQTGVYTNPTATSISIQHSVVYSPADLDVPTVGIWTGNQAPNPLTDVPGSVVIQYSLVEGPGGGVNTTWAGSVGIIAQAGNLQITDTEVSGFSATQGVAGGTFPPDNGFDWWEGTQSVGLLVGCPTTTLASDCVLSGDTITDNAIGVAVIVTDASFSAAWETGPISIEGNVISDSGGYGVFTEMGGTGGTPVLPEPVSEISGNTFDNTVTGAPALDLSGQGYDVASNVFVGTSASGTQGPVQTEGGPTIATASVEATDYWTYSFAWTTVVLQANVFLNTTLYWSTSFAPGSQSSLSGGELVTFQEVGLSSGTTWGITLNVTTGRVVAPASIVGDLQNGTHAGSFTVVPVAGENATPTSGELTVSGSPVTQTITFGSAAYAVTFTESGLAAKKLVRTGWSVAVGGVLKHSTTSKIVFAEDAGSYDVLVVSNATGFRVSSLTGFASLNPDTIAVHGATSLGVSFAKGKEYTLTFHEKGLRSTSWCVEVAELKECTTKTALKFVHLSAGTYAYDVLSVAGETVTATLAKAPLPTSGNLPITQATKVALKYVTTDAVRSLPHEAGAEHGVGLLPTYRNDLSSDRSSGARAVSTVR